MTYKLVEFNADVASFVALNNGSKFTIELDQIGSLIQLLANTKAKMVDLNRDALLKKQRYITSKIDELKVELDTVSELLSVRPTD